MTALTVLPGGGETGNAVADLTRRVNAELLGTDSLMAHLEHRVIALEAIVAAPWPLRLVAAWRLGRALRRSIRHYPGDTFAVRRTEAMGNDWIST
jgi:hypothetical protein